MQANPRTSHDDRSLFSEENLGVLRSAVDDLSWLLGRSYAPDAALKLVGDRYQLRERQRTATRRASCSDAARDVRSRGRLEVVAAEGQTVWVDGFNLLITFATALQGGLLLRGRDGVVRDLASSNRLTLIADSMLAPIVSLLGEHRPKDVRWVFDRPVPNSGRIAQEVARFAEERGLDWHVEVVNNPDTHVIQQSGVVVSSDAMILDAGVRWVDMISPLIAALPEPWIIDLGRNDARETG